MSQMNRTLYLATALASGLALLGVLSACALSKAQSDEITTTLTRLGNTAVASLTQQRLVALAATPPDLDGAACAGSIPTDPADATSGTGAQAVAAAVKKINLQLGKAPLDPLTTLEVATVYQPGSDQFNWVVKTIETACIAKLHDVNQAINSTTSIFAALPTVLALAPAGL